MPLLKIITIPLMIELVSTLTMVIILIFFLLDRPQVLFLFFFFLFFFSVFALTGINEKLLTYLFRAH